MLQKKWVELVHQLAPFKDSQVHSTKGSIPEAQLAVDLLRHNLPGFDQLEHTSKWLKDEALEYSLYDCLCKLYIFVDCRPSNVK